MFVNKGNENSSKNLKFLFLLLSTTNKLLNNFLFVFITNLSKFISFTIFWKFQKIWINRNQINVVYSQTRTVTSHKGLLYIYKYYYNTELDFTAVINKKYNMRCCSNTIYAEEFSSKRWATFNGHGISIFSLLRKTKDWISTVKTIEFELVYDSFCYDSFLQISNVIFSRNWQLQTYWSVDIWLKRIYLPTSYDTFNRAKQHLKIFCRLQ